MVENSPDRQLFNELYLLHGRAIFAHVRALVPNAADADDVFQETVRALWEKFCDYRSDGDFRAWACRIAYYKALQLNDRAYRSPRLFSGEFLEAVSERAVSMSDTLDAQSAALALCREQLSRKDQELLQKYYRPGMKPSAVARSMGRSVDTVYRHIRRIHDVLFDCVQRRLALDAAAAAPRRGDA